MYIDRALNSSLLHIPHVMDYKEILKDLRKESHSVKARLQSIIYDHLFVSQFATECLVANERCGSWYLNDLKSIHSAYFKSTDGHTGEWKFSMRRLNFHLLPLLAQFSNLVLVDSTRKGKLMSDALLKTVPIWCAVLNYIMFEGDDPEELINGSCDFFQQLKDNNWLLTPEEMVSRSEHASIVRTIPIHARSLKQLGLISKDSLLRKLGKKRPILPLWISPGRHHRTLGLHHDAFTVCCLTASYKMTPGFVPPDWNYPFPYVQGAGDDHELWASKDICAGNLTPLLFWTIIIPERRDLFRITDDRNNIYSWLSEEELIKRMNLIYEEAQNLEQPLEFGLNITQLGKTGLTIGAILRDVLFCQLTQMDNYSMAIVLSESHRIVDIPASDSISILNFQVQSSKKGAKKLREILPQILDSVRSMQDQNILIACDSGTDLSVAVALGLLCLNYDLDWRLLEKLPKVNKDVVKQHLALISEYCRVNPSRNTLQSLNTCLMG